VNLYVDGPYATSAFHLLTIIDFLCLAAGAYLLLILHDRERRLGYLLAAIAFSVLALRIISAELTLGDPLLQHIAETLSLSTAAVTLVWGTLSLVERSKDRGQARAVRRALLAGAAAIAVAGTLIVWALPFWDGLRGLLMRATAGEGFIDFMNGLQVAVAAGLVSCTWITWERAVFGRRLSRLFGAAYILWAVAIMVGIVPIWAPESSFWMRHIVWVMGSLFIGNALAVHVYDSERRALERQKRLRLVDRVASAAIAAPHLMQILQSVAAEVSELFEARLVAVYLQDSEVSGRLNLIHWTGDEAVELPKTVDAADNHPLAWSVKDRMPVDVMLCTADDADVPAVVVPLVGLNEAVGALAVAPEPDQELSRADMTALANAGSQLGVIVKHTMLLEDTRHARDRWRQTFDSLCELVTVHDAEGRIVLANSAVLTFAGVGEEDVIGSSLAGIMGSSEDQDQMLATCVKQGVSPGASVHRAEGRVHQVMVTPLRDESANVVGCVRVARDITSRWRAEDRLAQSERRYRELAENANDIIYTHDLEGNFLYVNAAAVRILGYSQARFAHLTFWDVVAPDSLSSARAYLDDLLAGKPPNQIELTMVSAEDQVVVVQLRANVVRRDGGSETIHGIARDVTAEKQLTAQLIQADRLASVGTLIAGIAHELNNPLTTISGYADLLNDQLAETDAADGMRAIAEQAERCRNVAQSLLSFARQTDHTAIHLDLNASIRSIFDLRAYDLRAADIRLETDLADDLHEVMADYGQIQQVVYNLVDNAYYALLQDGGGTLTVRTRNEDGAVVMQFADTGAGIPDSVLDHVFEPFVTTKPHGEGTGLGLTICRRIIQRYGGTMSAANREGGGAIFEVSLPIPPAQARRVQEAEADRLEASDRVENRSTRVLVIDDEPPLRNMVREYLTRQGYRVTAASTGEEGLELALTEDFDAIVCDMRLPGIGGEEVCSRLLEHRPGLRDRILVATGDILSPKVRDFFGETGLPHIHKPFKLVDLTSNIDALAAGVPPPRSATQ
jgi:PAS domain S-box-containing protein